MGDETPTDEKMKLAEELFEVHTEIQRLEKKKAYLKDKLGPMLAEGERVGSVEKVVTRPLDVGSKLLDELEERFGPTIVKRSVNTTRLRDLMNEDPALDAHIPRKKTVAIRVGEKWGG